MQPNATHPGSKNWLCAASSQQEFERKVRTLEAAVEDLKRRLKAAQRGAASAAEAATAETAELRAAAREAHAEAEDAHMDADAAARWAFGKQASNSQEPRLFPISIALSCKLSLAHAIKKYASACNATCITLPTVPVFAAGQTNLPAMLMYRSGRINGNNYEDVQHSGLCFARSAHAYAAMQQSGAQGKQCSL